MNGIFYNNGSYRELTNELLRQIDEAKTWIKACNLFFDDTDIREALLKAAERGVAIFILTNLQGVTGERRRDKVSGKIKQDAQSTQGLFHSASLKKLYNAGAHISGLDGLHAKFMLTDANYGIITSLNFSPNSTNKISELGVVISDTEYKELEEVFDYLFLRPDKFRFADRGSHFSYERPSETIDDKQLSMLSKIKMTLGPTDRGLGLALADCNCHDLRDEIFQIIEDTNQGESLYIATYSLNQNAKGPNGETIGAVLKRTQKRGAVVNVVMREDKKEYINGISISYHEDNHAKAVLNEHKGIIFTGNLTAESFKNGFDLGVVLTKEQIEETREFIKKLINQTKR